MAYLKVTVVTNDLPEGSEKSRIQARIITDDRGLQVIRFSSILHQTFLKIQLK
jgi:hypothetical protein